MHDPIEEKRAESRAELLDSVSKLINTGDPFIFASFPRNPERPIEVVSHVPRSDQIEALIHALLNMHEKKLAIEEARANLEIGALLYDLLFRAPKPPEDET